MSDFENNNIPNEAPVEPQPQYQAAPVAGRLPSKSKEKVVAGILGILLGSLGIHKFYLGYTKQGVIMLVVSLLGAFIAVGPAIMGIIGLIEGILYITKSDEDFDATYVVGDKGWF